MIILTMLQEGKITTEEAYDLLEALALSQEASREGLADQWDEVKVRLERAGEVVEEQVEKGGKNRGGHPRSAGAPRCGSRQGGFGRSAC